MRSLTRLCVLPRHFLCESLVLLLFFVLPSECFEWRDSVYTQTVFANHSKEALFRWKYVLGQADSANIEITCGYIPRGKTGMDLVPLVKKRGHNSQLTRINGLPGRGQVVAYQENLQIGKVDRSVVGFIIKTATLDDPLNYICLSLYMNPGEALEYKYTKVKKLVVLDPPVLKNCLEFLPSVREGQDIEIKCYVTGNPAPTLQCRVLTGFGVILMRYPKPATIGNITHSFVNIPREAEEIMCIADGGAHTGTTNITQWLEVHHTPSEPNYVGFIPAINTSSLNIEWSVILNNETGGDIRGYMIEYYKAKELRVSRVTKRLPIDKLIPSPNEGYYIYQLHGLYPDDKYVVEVSGYNDYGNGHVLKKTVTPAHIESIRPSASSASVGAIIGGIIAGIVFIVIFVILAVWCSTRSKKREKLPTSIVEEAVDYPQGVGQSLYANIDKNKNKTSRAGSTNEYPDVVHDTSELRPMVSSNSYEPSNKSFV